MGPKPVEWTEDHPELAKRVLKAYSTGCRYLLEIGQGNSTTILRDQASTMNGMCWSIDVNQSSGEGPTHLTRIKGDSLTVPWEACIDFLYLDGCHDPHHVWHEMVRFIPYVNPGGWVVMDDIRDHGYPRMEHVVENFCQQWGLQWWYGASLPDGKAVMWMPRRCGTIESRHVTSSTDQVSKTVSEPHECDYRDSASWRP